MGQPERIADSPTPGSASGLTTLASSMTASQTTIPVSGAAPAALQGTGQCRVLIDSEIIVVDTSTTSSTSSWTVITRGAGTSTAAIHNAGATVYHMWSADALQPALYQPLIGVAQSGAFTARVGAINYCTGAITGTLPNSPADDSECAFVSLTGTVTINRGGTNTISELGLTGQTSTLVPAGTHLVLKYLSGVWYPVRDSRSLPSLTGFKATYAAVTLAAATDTQVTSAMSTTPSGTNGLYDNSGGALSLASHNYTVKYPGVYRGSMSGSTSDASAPGWWTITLWKGGVAYVPPWGAGGNSQASIFGGGTEKLANGDVITLSLWSFGAPSGQISGYWSLEMISQ